MSDLVIDALVRELQAHILEFRLQDFTCSFHGGEPTLYGATRLETLLRRFDEVGANTECDIRYAITTNGALLDNEWVDLISRYEISVTVSIDGPPDIHDRRRVDVKGSPTWHESVAGYFALCRAGIAPSIIAVCDPESDPIYVLDHLAKDLGVRFCDILVPDSDYTSDRVSIAPYYIRLFDHWYDSYADGGLHVRFLVECIRGLFGLQSRTESIGLAPTKTVCLNSNGKLEPHDVLRIGGHERIDTSCSILSNRIADIESDPLWLSVRETSVNLCETCQACRYRVACGGGHIAQRWSIERGYNNPSIYCGDYIRILDHIANRLKVDISVTRAGDLLSEDDIYWALADGKPSIIFGADAVLPSSKRQDRVMLSKAGD
jgi:uncharacterized protein